MNPRLAQLQSYPFEKLAQLKQATTGNPELEAIALSIGEPKHPAPDFVLKTFGEQINGFNQYPSTKGTLELRQAICDWLSQRFNVAPKMLSAEDNVLPVNGTREALFAFAQLVIDPAENPLVIMPNPFYQIYEGAAFLSGAEPYYLPSLASKDYQPDFSSVSAQDWQRCQLLYLCSPNNPTGAVLSKESYQALIALSDQYDFIIASDECYSEIYPEENNPPAGLLGVCAELGRDDFKNCVVFHSLSKRSNLPGMRSGFVAGDKHILQAFLSYRTYHGCAMPIPTQRASIAAWQDEEHVIANRVLYREKFTQVAKILEDVWPLSQPDAGFNFWAKTPISDVDFSQRLFAEQHITVLPGSYLSRGEPHNNPGSGHVRMAMVAPLAECVAAAERMKTFINAL